MIRQVGWTKENIDRFADLNWIQMIIYFQKFTWITKIYVLHRLPKEKVFYVFRILGKLQFFNKFGQIFTR